MKWSGMGRDFFGDLKGLPMLDFHPGLLGENSSRLNILVLSPPDFGVLGGPTDDGALRSGVAARLRSRSRTEVSRLVMISDTSGDFHFLHFTKKQAPTFATRTGAMSQLLVCELFVRCRARVKSGTEEGVQRCYDVKQRHLPFKKITRQKFVHILNGSCTNIKLCLKKAFPTIIAESIEHLSALIILQQHIVISEK